MNQKEVCIVIPVYKSSPNIEEMLSFERCLQVFHEHPISVCTYMGLDISEYISKLNAIGAEYTIDYFDKHFFRNTDGYNELHLSAKFYKHYMQYEYMLIYQLDAYVFEDKLMEWMDKGYDYIGAPWLDDSGQHFMGIGNGGFCLKKTSWWYNELYYPRLVWSPKMVRKLFPITDVRSFVAYIARCIGYKNTVHQLFKGRHYLYNEDKLPNLIKTTSWRHIPKLPSEEEALRFSFERFPSRMYALCNMHLPMGCHAWQKHEYEIFWKKYIV